MINTDYTVVIPSIGRQSLYECIESVLMQTHPPKEIIVVGHVLQNIDIASTEFTLVTFIKTRAPLSSSENREIGTKAVKTEFVAYLDDDDIWFPDKAKRQFELIDKKDPNTIYNCRALIKSNFGNFIWPKRLIESDEGILHYLFEQISLVPGMHFFPITGYLMKSELAKKVGWQLSDHDDWDFLLRAEKNGAKLVMYPDVLVSINQTKSGVSRSNNLTWPSSFLLKHGHLMTRNQYRNYLAGVALQRALNSRSFWSCCLVTFETLRRGFFRKSTIVLLIRVLKLRNLFKLKKYLIHK